MLCQPPRSSPSLIEKIRRSRARWLPRFPESLRPWTGSWSRIRAGGRLFYIGAGTSGRLGVLDAAECPPTFHVAPDLVQGIIAGGEAALARATEASEDDPEAAGAISPIADSQAKTLWSESPPAAERHTCWARSRPRAELGALTIGISCTPDSPLSRAVRIAITPLVGPEVIAGSTRMKAGTATKLVLNMISTAVMIRLGYVYGNLMVNVQPSNAKLEDRATRIIAASAAVSYERAGELLSEAGGDVRVAIVMARLVARSRRRRSAPGRRRRTDFRGLEDLTTTKN